MTRAENAEAHDECTAEEVERYLKQHPDFLSGRPVLLAELAVSHDSGVATSLIERQVAVLRDQSHYYRSQLNELMNIAQDNDRLAGRFRALSLAFMDAPDAPDAGVAIRLLESSLREDFVADYACLLWPVVDAMPQFSGDLLSLRQGQLEALPNFPKALLDGKPICGRFSDDLIVSLFDDRTVGSAALVPIRMDGGMALLAIGCADESHFHADQGTIFLEYLGALLARRLFPAISD